MRVRVLGHRGYWFVIDEVPITPAVWVEPVVLVAPQTFREAEATFQGIDCSYLDSRYDYRDSGYREARRTKGLPSYTDARFAEPHAPRAPAQPSRAAFVRCYQRHRESRTRPEVCRG